MKKILAFVLTLVLLVISIPIGTFSVSAATTENTYAVGDIVEFGSYKQSAIKNANGETTGFNVEPLKWRVLKIENGKALLLTEEVIDNKYYNSTSATVDGYYGNNYAHSDIREWLINDFYNTAFSSAEKNCIVATTLDNSAAPTNVNASGSYTKYSSEPTTDKVFLLSKDEANAYASKYFRTTGTDYALSQGYQLYSGAGSIVGDNWTLRTAGNNTYQIYTVHVRWGEHVTYFNWYDDTITTPRGVRPAIYLDLDNYNQYNNYKRVDGFNFYMNTTSNTINVGDTVRVGIGYYKDNVLDSSINEYIYTISDSDIVKTGRSWWDDTYGQHFEITALKEGTSTITVTHPKTGESSTLDIIVTPNNTGYTFYNIPKMSIEVGKTTNFYNYSGMVVDDFAYTEHKNSSGVTDYYNVTMTIYNSINLYGVVTSYYPDGSIYAYSVIDKMDSHDSSFTENLGSLYYSFGDLVHLIKNDKYYSGKSISTENPISIDVPVGGHISISNNVAISKVANLVNFVNLLFDMSVFMGDLGDWDVSGKYVIEDAKEIVNSKVIAGILANKEIADELIECLEKSAFKAFDKLSFENGDLIKAVVEVNKALIENFGFNIIEEVESEICSVMGLASIGESIATKFLPTGWIIEGMYAFSKGCDFAVFFNAYCKSKNRPTGINIYAPTNSSKYQSNGVIMETEDFSKEKVIHAYTIVDKGLANIKETTFVDETVFYGEKYQTYDITMYKNGTVTQPSSPVTVKLPIPKDYNLSSNTLKVYRNNDDGTLTDMNGRVEGNYMVFVTEHFSYYSLVDESEPTLNYNLAFSEISVNVKDGTSVECKVNKDKFSKTFKEPYVAFSFDGTTLYNADYAVVDDEYYVFEFKDIVFNQPITSASFKLYAKTEDAHYVSETKELDLVLPGDVCSDNRLNLNDLVTAAQYVAGWDVECNTDLVDVNNDATGDLSDVVSLSRYLAGWDDSVLSFMAFTTKVIIGGDVDIDMSECFN